ncbi:prostaglandin reductase 1-like [Pollicipes pollicipes]|uniref:prostaglandin reductase 1-like n=1 Tax=Pollicipes pollicipes TaxID=41117 RepID=UPI00188511D3|nr:prostaglandin reductase 1-like [Pollicipes pollicipes]XP_037088672.1 prostaglandin reductase 1-like [Pollicipes pollicipes]XP_037088673.1 prostaglandin reductase 1-like [Pollicipes pollicipes]XP_037088674.1 prostaglandin reductase 1-like [Pollicipes pollicipes]XP_037088675.1 prostaglandin reductase 1-like [Pollicipes pollicipes]
MGTFLTSRLWTNLSSHLNVSRIRAAAYSSAVRSRKWVLVQHFDGFPKHTDFELREEPLPGLKDGEYLCEAEWISVDPYQRAYTPNYQVPMTMIGLQCARVLESRCPDYPEGSYVVGGLGWRTHAVRNPSRDEGGLLPFATAPMPEMGALSRSHAVGACGMPGNTAYFGLLELCRPTAGETVVVSGAAGAVGTLVGQIAKKKGCTVVGFAGSDSKCDWLRTLGFDHAINYKTAKPSRALREAAPGGVDCYFDNVGGWLSDAVMCQMNLFGRVALCGCIAGYNDPPGRRTLVPMLQMPILSQQLRLEGFIVSRWSDRWQEGVDQMRAWVEDGSIRAEETITEGFENLPDAFMGMLAGQNTGKAVVKV